MLTDFGFARRMVDLETASHFFFELESSLSLFSNPTVQKKNRQLFAVLLPMFRLKC